MDNVFGYARVSTEDQDLLLQQAALTKYGADEGRIFSEHASGKTMNRKSLKRVLKIMREGDVLVVWKLDRLGRTLSGVLEMIESLNAGGISLVSLTENFDTQTPMGKAFMQISLVFAELERNMASERTKASMAARKAAGKRFGRRPLIWVNGRGSEKRMAYLRALDAAGLLRDQDGTMLISAEQLTADMNLPKNMGKGDLIINNPETVRRWWRDGFAGLDADKTEG